tara:strand:- start:516 stop:932 length:417 start_codon:yes stop_codon:yes gene_type:complete
MKIKKYKKNFFIYFILIILLQLFYFNYSYSLDPEEILKDSNQEYRARIISKNIRCLVCQNQSIDESEAPLAKDLRIIIRSKIVEGKSDNEIYNFLVNRYGNYILLKPPINKSTFMLWILPAIFFILAIWIIYYKKKKN